MSRKYLVFKAIVYLEPLQRFENMVRIGRPESCYNSTSKSVLDVSGGDLTAFEKDELQ